MYKDQEINMINIRDGRNEIDGKEDKDKEKKKKGKTNKEKEDERNKEKDDKRNKKKEDWKEWIESACKKIMDYDVEIILWRILGVFEHFV